MIGSWRIFPRHVYTTMHRFDNVLDVERLAGGGAAFRNEIIDSSLETLTVRSGYTGRRKRVEIRVKEQGSCQWCIH